MTEEQRSQYEAQGYLVVEGVLDGNALSRTREAFERAERDGGLEALPNQDTLFIQLAEQPVLFPLLHRILGDDIQVRSLRGIRMPADGPGRGWHREVAGLLGVHHPLSTLCLQAFLHLDDTPESGACLAAVPGSHRFKSDLPFPAITYIEEMPHHVALRVSAGTAVVMHGNLWQARLRNSCAVPQRLLEYTYVHSWMRQALPVLSARAMEAASATHNLRQLFGIPDPEPEKNIFWGRRIAGYGSSSGVPGRPFSPLKVVGKGAENR